MAGLGAATGGAFRRPVGGHYSGTHAGAPKKAVPGKRAGGAHAGGAAGGKTITKGMKAHVFEAGRRLQLSADGAASNCTAYLMERRQLLKVSGCSGRTWPLI